MPLVTICINNKNDGKYLPELLDSLEAQDSQDFHVVGIDAGSTDCSLEVYERYGIPVCQCGDLNQPQSVNRVVRETESMETEFFAWINADDIYCPNFISSHVQAFREHREAGVAYSDCQFFWEGDPKRKQVVKPTVLALKFRHTQNPIVHPTTMIRRSLFDRIGMFDETILYPFDFEFWIRTWKAGIPLHHIPEVTARYRSRADNLTARKRPEIIQELIRLSERYQLDGSYWLKY